MGRGGFTIATIALIGCNAVSGVDGLSVAPAEVSSSKSAKKPPKGTSTLPDEPTDDGAGGATETPRTDADASSDDAGLGTVTDAGGTTTTTSAVSIGCATTTCTGTTSVCCDSATSAHCSTRGACAGFFEMQCDDNADCAAGQVCCVTASANISACQSSCASSPSAGRGLICTTNAQCPTNQACAYGAVDAQNQFISDTWGFCGPP